MLVGILKIIWIWKYYGSILSTKMSKMVAQLTNKDKTKVIRSRFVGA